MVSAAAAEALAEAEESDFDAAEAAEETDDDLAMLTMNRGKMSEYLGWQMK